MSAARIITIEVVDSLIDRIHEFACRMFIVALVAIVAMIGAGCVLVLIGLLAVVAATLHG